jgi:hypothetical protein
MRRRKISSGTIAAGAFSIYLCKEKIWNIIVEKYVKRITLVLFQIWVYTKYCIQKNIKIQSLKQK